MGIHSLYLNAPCLTFVVLSGLVLSDLLLSEHLEVLHTQYSLPCLCTLNQTLLCDVRLETGALPRAGLVPSVVTHISVSLSHLAPTSIISLAKAQGHGGVSAHSL